MRCASSVRRSLVGLTPDVMEQSPFALSGGQKRRVAIAGVLAMEPEVLVLDEPTAGLDPRGRRELLQQLKRMHGEYGITVVLVSHGMEDIASYAGRIVVMNRGAVFADGTPAEVYGNYKALEKIGLTAPQVTPADRPPVRRNGVHRRGGRGLHPGAERRWQPCLRT